MRGYGKRSRDEHERKRDSFDRALALTIDKEPARNGYLRDLSRVTIQSTLTSRPTTRTHPFDDSSPPPTTSTISSSLSMRSEPNGSRNKRIRVAPSTTSNGGKESNNVNVSGDDTSNNRSRPKTRSTTSSGSIVRSSSTPTIKSSTTTNKPANGANDKTNNNNNGRSKGGSNGNDSKANRSNRKQNTNSKRTGNKKKPSTLTNKSSPPTSTSSTSSSHNPSLSRRRLSAGALSILSSPLSSLSSESSLSSTSPDKASSSSLPSTPSTPITPIKRSLSATPPALQRTESLPTTLSSQSQSKVSSSSSSSTIREMRVKNLATKSNSVLLLDLLLGRDEPELARIRRAAGCNPAVPAATPRTRAASGELFLGTVDGPLERCVQYLLTHGADPNHRDADGNCALLLTLQYRNCHTLVKRLLFGGAEAHGLCYGLLLTSDGAARGARVGSLARSYSFVDLALRLDQADAVRSLLKRGGLPTLAGSRRGGISLQQFADVHEFGEVARVHLRRAMFNSLELGDIDMLEASVRHGAPINVRDSRGRTLLHIAIESSSTPEPYIQALLNSSADVNSVDNTGTPLCVYPLLRSSSQSLNLLSLLVSYGLNPLLPMGDTTLSLTDNDDSASEITSSNQSILEFARACAVRPEAVSILEGAVERHGPSSPSIVSNAGEASSASFPSSESSSISTLSSSVLSHRTDIIRERQRRLTELQAQKDLDEADDDEHDAEVLEGARLTEINDAKRAAIAPYINSLSSTTPSLSLSSLSPISLSVSSSASSLLSSAASLVSPAPVRRSKLSLSSLSSLSSPPSSGKLAKPRKSSARSSLSSSPSPSPSPSLPSLPSSSPSPSTSPSALAASMSSSPSSLTEVIKQTIDSMPPVPRDHIVRYGGSSRKSSPLSTSLSTSTLSVTPPTPTKLLTPQISTSA